MVGIASFEVAISAPISLYAAMNDDFFLEIGPNTRDGEINHITVSYLVLSLFPECGSCSPFSYDLGDRCVEICPPGF
jgi:hypothetical protein